MKQSSGFSVGITTRFLLITMVSVAPVFLFEFSRNSFADALAVCSISILIGAIGTYLLTRQLDTSIERLERATEKFAGGDLDYRVYPSRIPQLGGLARGLNVMGTQLRDRVNALVSLTDEQDAILRSMIEGVITVDGAGRIMRVNQAAQSLLRIDQPDVVGRSIPEIVPHAEAQKFMAEAMSKMAVTSQTISLWMSSDPVFLEVTAAPLTSQRGPSNGMLFVFHDVTRVQKLERVRSDFVGNVSHELRTPITSIKGFVETLLDGAIKEPELGNKFLEIISRHVDRLSNIVSDLLTLSRLEASGKEVDLEFMPYSIKSILEGVVETCSKAATEKGIIIEMECPSDLKAHINPGLFEQAILNLIDNAVKHTESGGQVSARVSLHDEMVRVDIKDTGCGIERMHLPRLFERFYRIDQGRSRKMGGTGLGLSIVKHICQVHGGHVEVESVVGQGSTFSMYVKQAHPAEKII